MTGGAGYFASWLIMRLLQHGYSVSTTVRSDPSIIPLVQYSNLILFHISDEPNHIPFLLISFFLLFILAEFKEDTSHLKALPGAPERLQIFDADLSKPDSFDAAMNGCVGVFHVAHPIIFDAEDPENMVIKPALKGTAGILRACLNSKTVKRVLYTSSASAVVFHGKKGVKEMDESVWTDVEFCSLQDLPISSYCISKTLTERAVLDFAQEHAMDVVTVVPSCVVGPFLLPHLPSSFSTSLALIRGMYHGLGRVAS